VEKWGSSKTPVGWMAGHKTIQYRTVGFWEIRKEFLSFGEALKRDMLALKDY
jgi:hypothetical protein